MKNLMEELNKKAKKQILAVVVIGAVLLIADMAMSYAENDIKIVTSEGQPYMLRPLKQDEPGHIVLRAKITGKKEAIEKKLDILIEPYSKQMDKDKPADKDNAVMSEKERLEYKIRNIVSDFNSNSTLKKIKLPTELTSGEKISWERENSNNSVSIMAAMLFIIAVIYKTRFTPLEKKRKEDRDSVIRQLPEFINRLVLLLNAGLVLNSAFEKSIEESLVFKTWEKNYFYGKMKDMYTLVKAANGSMYIEFRSFAKESGIKELMRISNIINDNVSKGVELTSKLQTESEVLWINRKRSCEERGRLAETKLTLPLVIFLMVLVVITVTPALLKL